MGVAGCGVPVCARTTGGCPWVATRSVAVSPAWCPDCRRLREWLCAVCAHRRLALGVLPCAHGVRLWRCCRCVRRGRCTPYCAACVVMAVICLTVRCVCPSREEGRSLASWGELCLCVVARQVSVVEQQPDQWQFPQRGVRTVVADVSCCVLCVRTARAAVAAELLYCACMLWSGIFFLTPIRPSPA